MTTCFESNSSAYCPVSKSSKSASASTETSPAEDSPLAGLMNPPSYMFHSIRQVQRLVASHSDELRADRTNNQYLVFLKVTNTQLTDMDKQRANIGKHIRMEHHTDTGDLIIKLMPSEKHQSAHITLADEIQEKEMQWGIPRENRLKGLGGTTFSGPVSSKEADTAFRPISRPIGGWPTIVFESGLSEGLARLRVDARWWLINSGGDVNVVLIISVKPTQTRLLIEKWCLSPATNLPVTGANPNSNALVPTKRQEVSINRNPANTTQPGTYTVTGGPLVLEFQSLYLRAPVAPEGDLILTTAILLVWARYFWEA